MAAVTGTPAIPLLKLMRDHSGPPTPDRLSLIIIDKSEATRVAGADGDRELGQTLKHEEVRRALEDEGLGRLLTAGQPLVIDAGQEADLDKLRRHIGEHVRGAQERYTSALKAQMEAAQLYLDQAQEERRILTDELENILEARLAKVREEHWPEDGPVRTPLDSLWSVMRQTHHMTLDATCRRQGRGEHFNVYACVFFSCKQQALSWLSGVAQAEAEAAEEILNEPRYADVSLGARQRRASAPNWSTKWAITYAGRVKDQLQTRLRMDPVWGACEAEWGRGVRNPPYRERVIHHLKGWGQLHGQVPALQEFSPEHQRPALPATRLDLLRVRNLRGIASLDLELDPQLTVLVGDNGVGKTTVLAALASCIERMALAIRGLPSNEAFSDGDLYSVEGEGRVRHPRGPLQVEVSGEVLGAALQPLRIQREQGVPCKWEEPEEMRLAVQRLRDQLSAFERKDRIRPPTLPLLCLIGEEPMSPGTDKGEELDRQRVSGYVMALSPQRSFFAFTQWYSRWDEEQRREDRKGSPGEATQIVAGVKAAVNAAMREVGWQDLEWDNIRGELTMVHPERGQLPLRLLSNGQRRVVSIVAELAHRCARLNPHLGEEAVMGTPGVVLIDEIDQHMHPAWQMRIIPALRSAFPLVQLVVTSHSPVVVAACKAAQVRILKVEGEGLLRAMPAQEDPRLLTAAELLMDFFELPSVTLNPHGDRLRDAAALSSLRNHTEHTRRRLDHLLAELEVAGLDVSHFRKRRDGLALEAKAAVGSRA